MKHDVYTALGNNVRAKLLVCLSRKPKSVTELIQHCGLSQSAVSQHLAKLKQSRLVKATKVGKQIFYALRYEKAAEIGRQLTALEKEVV